MSMAFSLPVAIFGGKQITIDGQPLAMPQQPAQKGQPQIMEKKGVREIDLPTPAGTLAISGKDLSVWSRTTGNGAIALCAADPLFA